MPGQFTIARCDHVGYVVPSLKEALRFWVDAMGATVERSHSRSGPAFENVTGAIGASVDIVHICLAGQRIELLEYSNVDGAGAPPLRPYDVGSMHLAINVDDPAAAIAYVAGYGFRPQGDIEKATSGSMYLVGPGGMVIEFRQARPD